jgi:hypothetical protein
MNIFKRLWCWFTRQDCIKMPIPKDCRDCIFRKPYRGHGECWDYCSHPESPEGYDSILWGCQSSFKKIPKWCPLGLTNNPQESE